MKEGTLSPVVAACLLRISEDKARKKYARSHGRVPLEAVRDQAGAAALELAQDLAHAREEVGRLSGQLKEVRAMNPRLQKEIKESVEERRQLTRTSWNCGPPPRSA